MRKLIRISLWILAAVVSVAVVLVLYLRNTDLSVYQEHIEVYLSEKIGHELDFDGLFELRFGSLTELSAEEVTLSNADWPTEPVIISAGRISVTIDLWSLIRGPLIIEEVDVGEVRIYLERDAERQANWMTAKPVSDEFSEFDTELIAFRDVHVESMQILYIDPARRRPLDILIEQLIVRPDDSDILDLDLQGTVNELPLWADGKLGPWQNLLDGRDLTADLDVTLGQLRLAVAGSGEDVRTLTGVEAKFGLSGPSIDRIAERLGLPPFAEGPFQIDGRLRKLDGGNQVRFEGNLGAIDVFASGSVDRLLNPGSTQFDFNVSGPDARHVAEVFGIDGVPEVPFRVTGDLEQEGKRLSFKGTRAELGENSVGIDGWLNLNGPVPDADVTVNAVGPDFSVFGPFINAKGVPAEQFDIDGRIEKSGSSWQFSNLVAIVGGNRVAANGSIGDGQDTEIEFSAAGPDISFLQPMTGLQGLPEKPYEVSARIRPAREGVKVEDAIGVFGDNRAEIDGVIGTGGGLVGTRLAVRARGPELHNIALLTGVPYFPTGPFEVSAIVGVDRNAIVIDNLKATAREMTGSASGRIGIKDEAGQFDLDVSVSGPDVGNLAQIELFQRLTGKPFSLSGHVKRRRDRDELEFVDTQVRIGEIELAADGTLSMEPLSNDSDLIFSLSGPDMRQLGRALGTNVFLAKTFGITGQFSGTPSGFAMRNFAAKIGDNDVNGMFEINLQEKPRLTGALSSTHLDLTERLQQAEEQRKGVAEGDEDELVLSVEPFNTEMLQAADIDIDFRVDRLQTSSLDVTNFHVGVSLNDGQLSVDPISFFESEGGVNGQILLTPSDGRYALEVSLAVQDMHIGMIASKEQDRLTLPPISGELKLHGAGNSVHELMASSNGMASLRQSSGRIKDLEKGKIFGDLLLNIIRTLNPLREKEEYRTFDCGIYDIDITDGVTKIEKFAFQTDTMTVIAVGDLDFETEKLDLVIRANPREGLGISVGHLVNTFLKVGGTLQNPKLQIDPEGTIVAGGVAVATGGLSLLAKGLFDRLSAEADICAQDEADNKD